jgi:hypothetical protein
LNHCLSAIAQKRHFGVGSYMDFQKKYDFRHKKTGLLSPGLIDINFELFLTYILDINFGVFRIPLNKLTAWRHFVAHQHTENAVGFGAVFDRNLAQGAELRVHGC